MYRIVIIGPGRGSNAEAIPQAKSRGQLGQTVIVSIVSDQPQARILRPGQPLWRTDSRTAGRPV